MRPKNIVPYFIDSARARLVISAVAIEFAIPETSIMSLSKGRSEASYARQVAMYLMFCIYGVTKSRIAEIFSRHFSTVSHACEVIEEQRDDPVLDAKIIVLENFLRLAPTSKAI